MELYQKHLEWINTQQERMIDLVSSWANINSHSDNLDGLAKMLSALKTAFSFLEGEIRVIPLPSRQKINSKGEIIEISNGEALSITKHPNAPIKIFLAGHMDTVYPTTSPFQTVELIEKNMMRGPGVADMKGGLVIMLKALQALEKSPFAGKIGWEVLINPDEEVGSQGSASLFTASAQQNVLGLLFEPAFSDGSIVSARKGSANFTVVARGKAAHAGRDFHLGRNAIIGLSRFMVAAANLSDLDRGITVNIGHIEGGEAVNIVPDLAICRLNARITSMEDWSKFKLNLQKCIDDSNVDEGISLVLFEQVSRKPKPFDAKNQELFASVKKCASDLGCDLQWKPSGGVCDGNILSAAGLPTIDSLGAIGGHIHTHDEWLLLSSLTERATLVAYFLMKVANGEISFSSIQKETAYERS